MRWIAGYEGFWSRSQTTSCIDNVILDGGRKTGRLGSRYLLGESVDVLCSVDGHSDSTGEDAMGWAESWVSTVDGRGNWIFPDTCTGLASWSYLACLVKCQAGDIFTLQWYLLFLESGPHCHFLRFEASVEIELFDKPSIMQVPFFIWPCEGDLIRHVRTGR